jgi:hypothetical protein
MTTSPADHITTIPISDKEVEQDAGLDRGSESLVAEEKNEGGIPIEEGDRAIAVEASGNSSQDKVDAGPGEDKEGVDQTEDIAKPGGEPEDRIEAEDSTEVQFIQGDSSNALDESPHEDTADISTPDVAVGTAAAPAPISRTSTPPLTAGSAPPAKKFSSVNVNRQFLKTVAPGPGAPATGIKINSLTGGLEQ